VEPTLDWPGHIALHLRAKAVMSAAIVPDAIGSPLHVSRLT
jgi:hypothetical protein